MLLARPEGAILVHRVPARVQRGQPAQLIGGQAEQALGGPVGLDNTPLGILEHDALAQRAEDGAETRLARLQRRLGPRACGGIDRCVERAVERARVVVQRRVARLPGDTIHLAGSVDRLTRQRPADIVQDIRAVAAHLEDRAPQHRVRRTADRGEAAPAGEAVYTIAIQHRHHRREGVEQRPVAGLTGLQGPLGLLAHGDILRDEQPGDNRPALVADRATAYLIHPVAPVIDEGEILAGEHRAVVRFECGDTRRRQHLAERASFKRLALIALRLQGRALGHQKAQIMIKEKDRDIGEGAGQGAIVYLLLAPYSRSRRERIQIIDRRVRHATLTGRRDQSGQAKLIEKQAETPPDRALSYSNNSLGNVPALVPRSRAEPDAVTLPGDHHREPMYPRAGSRCGLRLSWRRRREIGQRAQHTGLTLPAFTTSIAPDTPPQYRNTVPFPPP